MQHITGNAQSLSSQHQHIKILLLCACCISLRISWLAQVCYRSVAWRECSDSEQEAKCFVRRMDSCIVFERPRFGSYEQWRGILIENYNTAQSLYTNTQIIFQNNSQQPISNIISTSAFTVTLPLDNKSCAVECNPKNRTARNVYVYVHQWRTQEFFSGGGVQQIQLRTEGRENGDLGAVAPQSGVLEAAVNWYKKFNFIW